MDPDEFVEQFEFPLSILAVDLVVDSVVVLSLLVELILVVEESPAILVFSQNARKRKRMGLHQIDIFFFPFSPFPSHCSH